jgi:hypothetical protein
MFTTNHVTLLAPHKFVGAYYLAKDKNGRNRIQVWKCACFHCK